MESSHRSEYGRAEIQVDKSSELYGRESTDSQQVWMSHGDHAEKLPQGFTVAATSQGVNIQSPRHLPTRKYLMCSSETLKSVSVKQLVRHHNFWSYSTEIL